MDPTPLETITPTIQKLRTFHLSGATLDISFRKQQLKKLIEALKANKAEIAKALHHDLRQSSFLAEVGEIDAVLHEAEYAIDNLDEWIKPESRSVPLTVQPGKAYLVREPLGVVLIIAPWNYPFRLTLLPLIGALAAGNCALLKPSEVSSASSQVIATLISKHFDSNVVAVVQGGPEVTQKVLVEQFDHIFYTGNGHVARVIMAAAAKHLTPVTLELGGKNPVYVDASADVSVAAKRIVWGKLLNAGQTCLAPDYVLAHTKVYQPLLVAMSKAIGEFYGPDPKRSSDFSRIINENHARRLAQLLDAHKTNIVSGGQVDVSDRYVAPTILRDVAADSPAMQDEIFGPILAVSPIESHEAAISFIRARAKPLSLYVFSGNPSIAQAVVSRTSSGSAAVNDTVIQVTCKDLPFGGVGASGTGSYHGRKSFETFSHQKSVLERPTWVDPSIRYPPYSTTKAALFKGLNQPMSLKRVAGFLRSLL